MPGVNFDRAAAFYDATRALPDGVAEQVRDAVLDRVGARPGTRFLEVGVGTGRIALPFVRAGHAYCGVDLSAAMLGALREKLIADPAKPGLACADAMALPFRPMVFDVVLLIHVIHLVDDHLETLAEVRRVLRPNGRVIISANEYAEQERRDAEGGRTPTGARLVTRRWNAILTELGIDRGRRPQGQWITDEALTADLERLGARSNAWCWPGTRTARGRRARWRRRTATGSSAVIGRSPTTSTPRPPAGSIGGSRQSIARRTSSLSTRARSWC